MTDIPKTTEVPSVQRVTDILMEELADTLDEGYASDEKHRLRENLEALARKIVGALCEPTEAKSEITIENVTFTAFPAGKP